MQPFTYANQQALAPGNIVTGTTTLQVEEPCQAWRNMAPRWELLEALSGGTYTMREGRERWLPREPKELPFVETATGKTIDPYDIRLNGSVCPPFYQRLESMLTGMLTRKKVQLEDVPDRIVEQLFNVDQRGNDLQRWIALVARRLLRYGHVGVLVDFPKDPEGQAAERPYWVCYDPRQIIGWRSETLAQGETLTQLRLYERLTVPHGDFGEEVVEQVRVLEPGSWRLFRKQSSKGTSFDLVDEGQTSLDVIPFAVAYADQTDLLTSRPPLEEVAWLNLQGYQRSSDLANQLHLAAVPRLMLYGFPAEVDEIEAGPNAGTGAPVDARAEFVEPAGTSYQYQFQHLDYIKAQIMELGLAAVIGQKMAAETAASKAIDRSQGDAALQVVAYQLQDMIDNCLRFHAAYLGEAQAGNCIINRDFVSAEIDPAKAKVLMELEMSGKITQETLLRTLAEGEVFGDEFDVDAEVVATEAIQQQLMEQQQAQLEAAAQGMPQGS